MWVLLFLECSEFSLLAMQLGTSTFAGKLSCLCSVIGFNYDALSRFIPIGRASTCFIGFHVLAQQVQASRSAFLLPAL